MAQVPTKQHNTIRSFALVCVAFTSLFIVGMRIWSTIIISSDGWCDRAIGTVKETGGRPLEAIGACFTLLNKQLDAVARNSLIDSGVIAICLLVLIVIVVAGGKLNFTAGKGGVSTSIGREEVSDRALGAIETAEGAEQARDDILAEEGAKPSPTPATAAPPKPAETRILE